VLGDEKTSQLLVSFWEEREKKCIINDVYGRFSLRSPQAKIQ